MVKVVCIAGTHSGVGKTSLSVGLMLALRQRGLVVQPFKVGPDFLDPMHHTAACGRPCINLDGWMLDRGQVLAAFHRHTAGADVAVIEGVMGLFDSRDGSSDDGSTAQIAKWLGAPVVLVVDCWAMARSAAAMVKGYAEFDPELHVRGVLLNKVGGAAHGAWLSEALEAAAQQHRLQRRVAVLGCIPKDEAVAVPERHLGLTMPHEQDNNTPAQQPPEQQQQQAAEDTQPDLQGPQAAGCSGKQQSQQQQQQQSQQRSQQQAPPSYLSRLASLVSRHVDLDLLCAIAAEVQLPADCSSEQAVPRPLAVPTRCRVAVARDEAFCFYYEDNLALLRAAGAELVEFSPLRDTCLPAAVSGVYIGGGYPERHCRQLAANAALMEAVAGFARVGGVVYAECGGLIYLCRGLLVSPQDTGSVNGTGPSATTTTTTATTAGSSKEGNGGGSTSSSGKGSSDSLVPLAGVLPLVARMAGMRMGYVSVEVLPGNPLFPAGLTARGQVYHFSEVEEVVEVEEEGDDDPHSAAAPAAAAAAATAVITLSGSGGAGAPMRMHKAYRLQQQLPGAQPQAEGYSIGNVLASYVHLHWGGCPALAAALVTKCAASGVVSGGDGGRSAGGDGGRSAGGDGGDNVAARKWAASGGGSSSGGDSSSSSGGSGGSSTTIGTGPADAAARGTTNSRSSSSSGGVSNSSRNSSIVSLLPSGTEILYALGLGDRLVGVSGFCDWPPQARLKPQAATSLVDVDNMTSDEIEAAMQDFKAVGVSPFAIDTALLAAQRPGLLLTQDACATCDADSSLTLRAMRSAGLSADTTRVLVLQPKTLAGVLDSILSIGAAAHALGSAQQLVGVLTQRLARVTPSVLRACPSAADVVAKCSVYRDGGVPALAAPAPASTVGGSNSSSSSSSSSTASRQAPVDACSEPPPPPQQQQPDPQQQEQQQQPRWRQPPRVLSLEGLNPLVLGGQWLPDTKLAAGAVDASGQQPGDPPLRITWEQVLGYAPDALLLCPCSRSPAAALPDVEDLTRLPGFDALPAAQAGRVYVLDHAFFSRPGPRLVDGVELLATLLHGVAPLSSSSSSSARGKDTSSSGGSLAEQHPAAVLQGQRGPDGQWSWVPVQLVSL